MIVGASSLWFESYFRFQPGEARAPFADDAHRSSSHRLEKAGKNFWNVLLEQENAPMTGGRRAIMLISPSRT